MFGKDNKKKELVNNLAESYGQIEREHQISPGDFPNLKRMQVTRVWGLQERDELAEQLRLGVGHPWIFWGNSSQPRINRQAGGPRPALPAGLTLVQ